MATKYNNMFFLCTYYAWLHHLVSIYLLLTVLMQISHNYDMQRILYDPLYNEFLTFTQVQI